VGRFGEATITRRKWTLGEKLYQGKELQGDAGLGPMWDKHGGSASFAWGRTPRPSPELHHATKRCGRVSLPCSQ